MVAWLEVGPAADVVHVPLRSLVTAGWIPPRSRSRALGDLSPAGPGENLAFNLLTSLGPAPPLGSLGFRMWPQQAGS